MREEGLVILLQRSFDFIRDCLFQLERCYLYEHTIGPMNENDYLPRIDSFTFKIVSSNKEADELAVDIGCDFRRRFIYAKKSLDKGATAFCIFVDGEIAHIGWVATTEDAKKGIDPVPYKVDFDNNEACTGGTETVPKHRGKGLMVYGYYWRRLYLRDRGIIVSRNSVRVNNTISQKAHARFNPWIKAEIRYLKLLGWEIYKEKPIPQTD